MWYKGTLTVQGVITVWLVSSFTGLDSSQKDDMLLFFMKESDWIQTSQTGDELYNDTKSPYGEWSPVALTIRVTLDLIPASGKTIYHELMVIKQGSNI